MQTIQIEVAGDDHPLVIREQECPQPAANELLVRIHVTALNRADLLQRQGKYPPPPGASDILGLEMAGEVVDMGAECSRYQKGDRIFGLLSGGGYAQYTVIHEKMALPVPGNMSYEEATAIPEAFLTAHQALQWLGKLRNGQTVLIHAGGSGVGTAAIQLAKSRKARVIITASKAKHDRCRKLGADHTIDYKQAPFDEEVKRITGGDQGVDLIIDFIGAPYLAQNLNSLKKDGRLVLLAFMGGAKAKEINLAHLLMKRLTIKGSTLRSRDLDYQIALTKDFWSYSKPLFKQRNLHPVIDKTFEWENANEAHEYMAANKNTGKIILKIK